MASPADLVGFEAPARSAMSDRELIAIVEREIEDSVEWTGSKLASDQRRGLSDYFGEKYGNERAGRSQVVSRDVFETVEWIKPALLEIFHSGDEVVRFDAVGPEDVEAAAQETALVNHVYMIENDGFLLTYHATADALLQKIGVFKSWYEFDERVEREEYTGLSDLALLQVFDAEGDVTPLEHAETQVSLPDGSFTTLHDLVCERRRKVGRVRIEVVPPEEFGVSKDAVTLDRARCVWHRVKKTESDLIRQGYAPEVVRALPNASAISSRRSQDADTRRSQEGGTETDGPRRSDASREVWVTEAYVRVDYDGDGYAELRRVTLGGDSALTLLDHEQVDAQPFSAFSPIMIPHRFYGLSVADILRDLQEMHTQILRNYLDDLNLKTNPRHKVLASGAEGAPLVDLDELLSAQPGGYVTEFAPGALTPLVQEDASGPAITGMELVRTIRENRIGVSRYSAGLDADTLNKTASGIQMIQNAAMQRIGLIARIFAETGFRHLFRRVSMLLRKHQDRPRTIRMRGKYIEVDPTSWRHEVDATIAVGIGHGNRDALIAGLVKIMELQGQMTQVAPGLIVQPKHAYAAAEMLAQKLGFKDGGTRFFRDPEGPDAEPPPPPAPDAKIVEIESRERIEMAKLAIEAQRLALDAKKLAAETQGESRRIALDAAKAMASVDQGKEPE
jgi:hypothetical protein